MANSNSGGGCLLFLIDWICGIIRNRRIKKYNKQARGVEEYQNIDVGVLFPPDTYRDNIIISGGGNDERIHICEEILNNAHRASHPVIILHTANGEMEIAVAKKHLGTVVNQRNKVFDAFVDFEFNEILQTVVATYKSQYDIKPAGRYVLQVVYELLKTWGKKPFFRAFKRCPYFELGDEIEKSRSSGTLTRDDADRLFSLLLTGQSEIPKIHSFFSDLNSQIDYMSAPKPSIIKPVSVLSAIKNNQILCIDLRSSANIMLVELIVNSLIIAMNRGYDFSLLIDDIALINNEMLKNTISQKSNHHNIIVSKDLYALTGGNEATFSTLIGEAEKTVIFAHGSNLSCEKWSKYAGEYEKIDVSYNINGGFSDGGRWGYNSNSGQNETLKREWKIKPEDINRLSQDEAFIYDKSVGSLIRTFIS